MKTSLLSWTMGLVAVSALVACGDDTAADGAGGQGGEGTGGATTVATTTTTAGPTTSSTSVTTGGQGGEGGGNTTSAGGGGSAPDCEAIEVTNLNPNPEGPNNYVGDLAIGGEDPDAFVVQFYGSSIEGEPIYDGAPGTFTLGDGLDANYETCARCVLVYEDLDADGVPARIYFANSGTLEVAEGSEVFNGTWLGALNDVGLVEVEIDPDTAVSTEVDGGECLSVDLPEIESPDALCESGLLAGAATQCLEETDGACDAFEACTDNGSDVESCVTCLQAGGGALCEDALRVIYDTNCFAAPAEWTCDADLYWDGENCDCDCGAGDPDCSVDYTVTLPVENCDAGESCSPAGTCYPTGWTCDGSFYGADDGCDCNCGVYDPDCDAGADMPFGCAEGQTCDAAGECAGVPTAWTCADAAYQDGVSCNCECGASDPDCANEALLVVGCGLGEVCSADACIPEGWVCSGAYYGTADGCDCGCGVVDPDCASAAEAECEYCSSDSCGNDGTVLGCDLALIVDANNAVCQ